MGYMSVIGRCLLCERVFSFNADWVPSIRWKDGKEDPAGERQPICHVCIAQVNMLRHRRGQEPIYVHPEAYEPTEVP